MFFENFTNSCREKRRRNFEILFSLFLKLSNHRDIHQPIRSRNKFENRVCSLIEEEELCATYLKKKQKSYWCFVFSFYIILSREFETSSVFMNFETFQRTVKTSTKLTSVQGEKSTHCTNLLRWKL